jgi:hypothetical protein
VTVLKLLRQLADTAPAEKSRFPTDRHVEVKDSDDLTRILALPRRTPPDEATQAKMAEEMTELLRLDRQGKPCDCARLRPEVVARGENPCITSFRSLQGWYLWESREVGGAAGFIPVGGGKTGLDIMVPMVVPGTKRAVLMIRPGEVKQLMSDWRVWGQHFKVPNIAGGTGPHVPGRPVLEVFPYSMAQRPENAFWWRARAEQGGVDLVIADECQRLKNRKASSTHRFLKHFAAHPETKFFTHSASFTTREVEDFCHLLAVALRESSPMPLSPSVVEQWGEYLNPSLTGAPADPGALRKLCRDESEDLDKAVHRRIIETRGVISTADVSVKVGVTYRAMPHPAIPPAITEALNKVRREEKRPDGETLFDAMEVATVAMQVACGFYYFWRFPTGHVKDFEGRPVEDDEKRKFIIDRWYAARKDWHWELREELKSRREGLDSPKLLRDAAERDLAGLPSRKDAPTWDSDTFAAWKRIEACVEPVPAVQWIDDYLARESAAWAKKQVGIVWYRFSAFGRRVAELTGLPRYGEKAAKVYNLNPTPAMLKAREGKMALGDWEDTPGDWIQVELGERSIIASLASMGTGRNLQSFHRQLWPTPPADGAAWEQGVGRCHRYGQNKDVTVDVFRHTREHTDAFEKACRFAEYQQVITGNPQKLLYGKRTWGRGA